MYTYLDILLDNLNPGNNQELIELRDEYFDLQARISEILMKFQEIRNKCPHNFTKLRDEVIYRDAKHTKKICYDCGKVIYTIVKLEAGK